MQCNPKWGWRNASDQSLPSDWPKQIESWLLLNICAKGLLQGAVVFSPVRWISGHVCLGLERRRSRERFDPWHICSLTALTGRLVFWPLRGNSGNSPNCLGRPQELLPEPIAWSLLRWYKTNLSLFFSVWEDFSGNNSGTRFYTIFKLTLKHVPLRRASRTLRLNAVCGIIDNRQLLGNWLAIILRSGWEFTEKYFELLLP
jgi:hypothetical protein